MTIASNNTYTGLTGEQAVWNGEDTKTDFAANGVDEDNGFVPGSPVPARLFNFVMNALQNSGTKVDVQEFTTSGNWEAPEGATLVSMQIVQGCGGGRGGDGGSRPTDSGTSGGTGGFGGSASIYEEYIVTGSGVLEDNDPVTVGAGGAAGVGRTGTVGFGISGGAGGDSIVGGVTLAGSVGAGLPSPYGLSFSPLPGLLSIVSASGVKSGGAPGDHEFDTPSDSNVAAGADGSDHPQNPTGTGGAGGAGGSSIDDAGNSGGGGGGGPVGSDALAGNGTAVGSIGAGYGQPGDGGLGYGAGGGGGGGHASSSTSGDGGDGGAGAPGFVRIISLYS